jgi:hypothetical protein
VTGSKTEGGEENSHKCVAGTYSGSNDDSECRWCPAGKYSDAEGATE